MVKKDGKGFLKDVYAAKDNRELCGIYDCWASEYDRHVQEFGYRIPGATMGMVGRYIPNEQGAILDAGAGTGIIGESLMTLKYSDVVALDLSKGMLRIAQKKGAYTSYMQAALGGPLDFPNDHFMAIVSAGTFTEGHAPPASFDELIRITRPGGRLVFTVLAKVYENGGFKEKQDQLEKQGCWRLLEMTDEFQSMPLESPDITNRVFAYEVLSRA